MEWGLELRIFSSFDIAIVWFGFDMYIHASSVFFSEDGVMFLFLYSG